jgi:hypothetical protein
VALPISCPTAPVASARDFPLGDLLARHASWIATAAPSDRCAVILCTGALNPVHRGHEAMMISARRHLESMGIHVLKGFISPSHRLYVEQKARALNTLYIPAEDRLRLVRESLSASSSSSVNDGWLEASGWECDPARSYWPDFPEVLSELCHSLRRTLGPAAMRRVFVLFVCGADHARKCGGAFGSKEFAQGMVVVPRHSASSQELHQPKPDHDRRVFVVPASPSAGAEPFVSASSTAVRAALEQGRLGADDPVASMVSPAVLAYLRAVRAATPTAAAPPSIAPSASASTPAPAATATTNSVSEHRHARTSMHRRSRSRSRSRSRDRRHRNKERKKSKRRRSRSNSSSSSSSSSDSSSSDSSSSRSRSRSRSRKRHKKSHSKHAKKKKDSRDKRKKHKKSSKDKRRSPEKPLVSIPAPTAAAPPTQSLPPPAASAVAAPPAAPPRVSSSAPATAVVPAPASAPAVPAPGPMTKEMYEREANKVRQVFDPNTGRVRLVKGTGEILEQMVSKAEQKRIRELSTRWDGQTRDTEARLDNHAAGVTHGRCCCLCSVHLTGRLMYGAPGER